MSGPLIDGVSRHSRWRNDYGTFICAKCGQEYYGSEGKHGCRTFDVPIEEILSIKPSEEGNPQPKLEQMILDVIRKSEEPMTPREVYATCQEILLQYEDLKKSLQSLVDKGVLSVTLDWKLKERK